MLNWFKFSNDMLMAGFEAQRVVSLRMTMLAEGGPAATTEASRMVTEKALASTEAMTTLMTGGSPQKVLQRYRTIMRANEKRLRNLR